jgi:LmbE family N-acetylglucosaminyl deacetylase
LLPIDENCNPLPMTTFNPAKRRGSLLRRFVGMFLVVLLICVASLTEQAAPPVNPTQPLPEDSGVTGLKETLLRLSTTARLMQDVAHPDDEDGGMLTLESRGKGDAVVLLTLNRGEGGQNKIGSNLFDVLGVLRTLELTAADRYYGVEQRFTRVADFGYSKTPEETFQKWQGHDIALGDVVRVIRTFRPDVLVARFSGTDRDGHGHHQASAILTREAFRAAADPARFPEQIQEGLLAWQVKKLYIGNVCGFGAKSCPDADWTVRLNTGTVSPLLGVSYIQFALEGLRHQLSQGAGGWSVEPGDRFTFYKLVESELPSAADEKGHEKDFFDGIDTSLTGLASRAGSEQPSFLRGELGEIENQVKAASVAAERDPASAAEPLLLGLKQLNKLVAEIRASAVSPATKEDLLVVLEDKREQFERAAALASGAELEVVADVSVGANADDAFMAVGGQSFAVTARFRSAAKTELKKIALDLPKGWTYKVVERGGERDPSTSHLDSQANPNASLRMTSDGRLGVTSSVTFRITVPRDAEYTRPYWHRNDPERDAVNTVDDPRYVTLPFPPPAVRAHAVYSLGGNDGVARAVVTVKYHDAAAGVLERAVAVAPAFSVMLEPGQLVIPIAENSASRVKVAVSSNLSGSVKGVLHLEAPAGWRVEPATLGIEFGQHGEKKEAEFRVFHDGTKEGNTEIRAVFESAGQKYSEGYSVVTRADLDTFYYYQPAVQRVSLVDVKVPKDLKVGYVMGAGDDIPTVLQQIGMDVTLVPAEKLASENLKQFGTIVLGIRANDTQKEIAENHQKLMDYVSSGGTLIVQYNTSVGDFNSDGLTPYPAELSRARVSVEEAPVKILAPGDSVFQSPNKITPHDFDGWVQERGLYFMDRWDDHFQPLLESHDPGEGEQKGGLLRAQFGKGTYIYTGYAFFRQLPAGVPGAIRLYVNLLSAKGNG